MDGNEKCFICNINLDKDIYKKDRTVCKDCYNKKKKKYNNKTIIQNQQTEIELVNTNKSNRTLLD